MIPAERPVSLLPAHAWDVGTAHTRGRDKGEGAALVGEVSHIGDLKPDEANPRSHNPRNIGMIVDSLQKVGAARSIVIDEDNVILAGNGVIEAAAQAGIENVRVIEANGSEIIAVRRTGLTPEQRTLLKYYDNRTTDTSTFDPSQIAADLEAGLDLSGMFYPEELSAILEQAADAVLPEFKEYDESVEDEVEYITCPECGHKWPK